MLNALRRRHAYIAALAEGIDPALFPYFCSTTGELGDSLLYVIRATITDWRAFRVIHHWHSVRHYQKGECVCRI